MSQDNRAAARELLVAERFRSSISRSFYAAYCAMTDALAPGVSFGHGGNNPAHGDLPNLIVSNLGGLPEGKRRAVRQALLRLWKQRVDADYVPAAFIDRNMAVNALRDANRIITTLGVDDDE